MNAFESYYANVPVEQKQRLRAFRETHPLKQAEVNGREWEYIACGQGEATILWLVGGLRVADAAYRSIPLMEDGFRILAPNYPVVKTLNELLDGLIALMETEGITKAHVLAGSFGGMVAQAFMRRHPKWVDKVVLSSTTAPDASLAARYEQQAAMLLAAPELAVQVSKPGFLNMIAPPDEERAFWAAYVDELFSERLGLDELVSTLWCMQDFANNVRFSPDDLRGWDGRILIIEADDDATFDASARERLRALYPMARVHTFEAAGHSPGTTKRDEYFALVREFFT